MASELWLLTKPLFKERARPFPLLRATLSTQSCTTVLGRKQLGASFLFHLLDEVKQKGRGL